MDFNRRHGHCGHLFQGRYKSLLVEERGYFAELGRYIHLNPVRGAVLGEGGVMERRRRLRAFEWSSYRAYAGLGSPPGWLRMEESFGELGLATARDRSVRYRRFVEMGLLSEIPDPREAAEAQAVLGAESFVRKVKDRLQAARERTERIFDDVSKRRLHHAVERGERLLDEMAEEEGISVGEFTGVRRYGDRSGTKAMAGLHTEAGWTLGEIGARFGGMRPGAVAQRIHRMKTTK